MLKFLQNYPLPEVFIDGKRVAEMGQKVGDTRANVGQRIETVIQQILGEPLCNCDAEAKTTEKS